MTAKPTRTATGPNGPSPLPDEAILVRQKEEAATWFASLRDRICAEFEAIEREVDEANGKLTTAQNAALDHDGDAGAGGSTPKAASSCSPISAAPRGSAIRA